MKRKGFPFAAVTGLETVKRAVLLSLVNPRCGGLLVSGTKGTGKSTIVRAAVELIDEPWTEVPVSVTEDRLFGSIDTEEVIRSGQKKLLPGLIDEVKKGILYMDDANLLRQELLLTILNMEAAGSYRLEREGLSQERTVDFTVLAVMAPEGGTLEPSILDRFGLFVQAEETKDPAQRMELLRRVMAYEQDSAGFRREWAEETEVLRTRIRAAKDILSQVEVSDAMIQLAAVYAMKALCVGHRADLYMVEAARAIAAWAGRVYVLPKDVEEASQYVLPHRMQRPPEEDSPQEPQDEQQEMQAEQNTSDQESQGQSDNEPPQDDRQEPFPDRGEEPQNGENQEEPPERGADQAAQEKVETPDLRISLPPIAVDQAKNRRLRRGSGKRNLTRTELKQGRYVRTEIPKGKANDIAFDATFRAAAPYQKLRKPNGCAIILRTEDIRSKVREKRTGNIFLFVVDASGSMGARERMRMVKGVIFKMLCEAYQKRDRIGMVAFRRDQAEVILPVTRSVDLAQKKLAALPTGGKTPLAAGLETAETLLDSLYRQDSTQEPVLILITDGRATAGSKEGKDPAKEAVAAAVRLGKRQLPAAVIDTESGFVKLGIARNIAQALGASYFSMDHLSQEKLIRIVRRTGR